jgi:hypothetical protein
VREGDSLFAVFLHSPLATRYSPSFTIHHSPFAVFFHSPFAIRRFSPLAARRSLLAVFPHSPFAIRGFSPILARPRKWVSNNACVGVQERRPGFGIFSDSLAMSRQGGLRTRPYGFAPFSIRHHCGAAGKGAAPLGGYETPPFAIRHSPFAVFFHSLFAIRHSRSSSIRHSPFAIRLSPR